MRTLKITFVFDACNLGGTEAAIKNRMDYLVKLGVDCQILFFYPAQEKDTFKNHKCFVTQNEKEICEITYDSDVIDNLSLLDIIFSKLYKMHKPIIHECHGYGFFEHLTRLDYSKVKAVFFPSNHQCNSAREYMRSMGKQDIPLYVLYNFLGHDFSEGSLLKNSLQQSIILWVGRMEQNKNWGFLIRLAQVLPAEYTIRVVTNSSVSSDYNKFLETVRRYNLFSRFQIVTNCPYNYMAAHYAEAAQSGCYLSSSLRESFGMTVLEAMSCSCPLVITDIPAFREIAGDCARYYDINNVNECLQNIQNICSSGLRDTMISREVLRYNSEFDGNKICSSFISVMDKIIDRCKEEKN